jgi:hypothetical protein
MRKLLMEAIALSLFHLREVPIYIKFIPSILTSNYNKVIDKGNETPAASRTFQDLDIH